jgi:hypothetical protein
MSAETKFKSAEELRVIAGKASGRAIPDELGDTYPIPHRTGNGLVILIMYYMEMGPPTKRVVHPPSHAMHLDPVSGKVLRFWACKPEELGIEPPLDPVAGAGIRPGMQWEELVQKRDRFLAISPQVWEAFAAGNTNPDPATKLIVQEYWKLFLELHKAEVAPFYLAAAPDFFGWLRQALGAR